MGPHRWPFAVVVLLLGGIFPAAAQFTGPPVVPRTWSNENLPGVGHAISTVDNFTGIVALAVFQGTGKDDKGNTIEFECDVRAMQGIVTARDGSTYRGTFSFTWLDLFSGSGPNRRQIHDLSFASVSPPFVKEGDAIYGPFWSGFIPETSVTGSPYTAKMTLEYTDAPQQETFVVFGPTSVPAKASVRVEWQPGFQGLYPYFDPIPTYTVRNPTLAFNGTYSQAGANIQFSFTSQVSATDKTPFTFTTNPEGQRLLFAQVGHESTGTFAR